MAGRRVLHQPRRAGQLLGVDRRVAGDRRSAAGAEIDLDAGGMGGRRGVRGGVLAVSAARPAADEPVSRPADGGVALLRHRPRPPRFRLRAEDFDGRRDAPARGRRLEVRRARLTCAASSLADDGMAECRVRSLSRRTPKERLR